MSFNYLVQSIANFYLKSVTFASISSWQIFTVQLPALDYYAFKFITKGFLKTGCTF